MASLLQAHFIVDEELYNFLKKGGKARLGAAKDSAADKATLELISRVESTFSRSKLKIKPEGRLEAFYAGLFNK